MTENEISKIIWDKCFRIHSRLGPGLFESVYEEILAFEMTKAGLLFERQKYLPVVWDGLLLENGFRADFLVENKVIIELKSVEMLSAVHSKQVLTYLKITHLKLGLLINFNSLLLKDGFQRIANKL